MSYKKQIENMHSLFEDLAKQMKTAKEKGQDDVYQNLALRRANVYAEITKLQRLDWDETHHRFDMDDR